jgi:hypothetical protein
VQAQQQQMQAQQMVWHVVGISWHSWLNYMLNGGSSD